MQSNKLLIILAACCLTLSRQSEAATMGQVQTPAGGSAWDAVDVVLGLVFIISLLLTIYLTTMLKRSNAAEPEEEEAPTYDQTADSAKELLTFNGANFSSPTIKFEHEKKYDTIRKASPTVEPGTILLVGMLSNRETAQYTIELAVLTERERLYIGRTKEMTDIHIQDSTISGVHAVLSISNDADGMAICLSDKNSRNGTFVNNEKLTGNREVKLRDGDAIRLGQSLFTLLFPAQ